MVKNILFILAIQKVYLCHYIFHVRSHLKKKDLANGNESPPPSLKEERKI